MAVHLIHFMRPITPDTLGGLQNVALSAVAQSASEIHIHLSSDGGSLDYGFASYHFLRSLPVPLTIHCIGNVESMAVMIYLAADTRAIVPHGKVKIHPMHWNFPGGPVDHDRLCEFVDSLDFDAKRYTDIFTERTQGASNPIDVAMHLAGKAKVLNASDAHKAGIATAIKDVVIPKDIVSWWV